MSPLNRSVHALHVLLPFSVFLALILLPAPGRAWDKDGHRMINRLAASSLPPDVPAFLRAPAALDEIEYLGPEPDRWRSPAEPELNAAQSPEHFIDLEIADAFAPLPRNRLDFEAEAFAAHLRPDKIGLQPWVADEVWERLKAAMRNYRVRRAAGRPTQPVEAVIVFYAGWLGHYVGDGAQPLHTTVSYNGWVGPNPRHYTTSRQIHFTFEGKFVADNIHIADVQVAMASARPIRGDMFDAYMAYLRQTHACVETLYQLEKAGGFEGSGTAESRQFVIARLAAGAAMLRDMIYSAWLDSAQPVPDFYASRH